MKSTFFKRRTWAQPSALHKYHGYTHVPRQNGANLRPPRSPPRSRRLTTHHGAAFIKAVTNVWYKRLLTCSRLGLPDTAGDTKAVKKKHQRRYAHDCIPLILSYVHCQSLRVTSHSNSRCHAHSTHTHSTHTHSLALPCSLHSHSRCHAHSTPLHAHSHLRCHAHSTHTHSHSRCHAHSTPRTRTHTRAAMLTPLHAHSLTLTVV